MYTYFGGLRATFLTDYVHTFIIMIILVWLTIKIIVVKEIGSIGALYEAVVAADKARPVDGNYGGSHLTMRSEGALFFGIIHVMYVCSCRNLSDEANGRLTDPTLALSFWTQASGRSEYKWRSTGGRALTHMNSRADSVQGLLGGRRSRCSRLCSWRSRLLLGSMVHRHRRGSCSHCS